MWDIVSFVKSQQIWQHCRAQRAVDKIIFDSIGRPTASHHPSRWIIKPTFALTRLRVACQGRLWSNMRREFQVRLEKENMKNGLECVWSWLGKGGGRFWNGFWEVQCVVVGNLKPAWSETGNDFIDEKHQRCGRSWGLELAGGSVASDLKYLLSKSFNNISHLSNLSLCTRKTEITKKSSWNYPNSTSNWTDSLLTLQKQSANNSCNHILTEPEASPTHTYIFMRNDSAARGKLNFSFFRFFANPKGAPAENSASRRK